jgi:hypothetical protein
VTTKDMTNPAPTMYDHSPGGHTTMTASARQIAASAISNRRLARATRQSVELLSREWNGSRSCEGAGEAGEDAEVGVKLNLREATDAERL